MPSLGSRVAALILGVLVAATPVTVAALPYIPQGPVRCYDGDVRFPNARNPRMAVQHAILDAGGNPFTSSPFMRTYLDSSPKIVAGWIAVSLFREQQGYRPPTLAEWIKEGNTLNLSLSYADWETMISWPPDSCEGAFVQNPANADLMWLVSTLVIRGG
jgi:hypothetical protein